MLQSRLFTKTRKDAPKDEVARNAELLIRGGYIHKEMAGVYSYLPLGLKVLKKIEELVREEMDGIGGSEMRTSVLQNKEVWEKSGRWDDGVVDNWFKADLKNGGEVGLSFTNEEAYSSLLTQYISSYKDLPIYPYDFKNIFRNEARSKSGILRGREFYWKALYSFSKDVEEHEEFYERAKQSYIRIFKKVGLGDITYLTFASGGSFSKYSHEFQTTTPAGEDEIYIDKKKGVAVNKEVMSDEVLSDLGIDKADLVQEKAVEVGNIFSLGTKFSEPFGLSYKDEKGEKQLVVMGSYGIGLGRLMGTVVEALSDEKGIIWPRSIAPFRAHILSLGQNEEAVKVYDALRAEGIEVLLDDRDASAGEKFADADLLGMPSRIVVGKTAASGKYELKDRKSGEEKVLSLAELIEELRK
jgi:prolyl-tRNA synthetase